MADAIARAVFGLLFETSAEGLFITDRHTGRILSANLRLAEMLARDSDAVAGYTLEQLAFEPGRDLSAAGQYEEITLRRSDDYPVYVTLTVSHVDDPVHGALGAYTARDTTERHLLERELFAKHSALFAAYAELETAYRQLGETKLQLEDRNREIALLAWRAAMGELVAGIAHHLNNPVGALASTIRAVSAVVARLPAEHRADLERLLDRVSRIADRIEGNVAAIISASRRAATSSPAAADLPQELARAMADFVERLDDIPTKERT